VRPKKNPEVKWRLEEGLYSVASAKAQNGEEYEEMGVCSIMCDGSIKQLNLVATEVWLRINGVNRLERIVEGVSEVFSMDTEAMREDVEEFLRSMEKIGWVTFE